MCLHRSSSNCLVNHWRSSAVPSIFKSHVTSAEECRASPSDCQVIPSNFEPIGDVGTAGTFSSGDNYSTPCRRQSNFQGDRVPTEFTIRRRRHAVLKVRADISCAVHSCSLALLTLFDLPAAFDAVDHHVTLLTTSSWGIVRYQLHCAHVVCIVSRRSLAIRSHRVNKVDAFCRAVWCPTRIGSRSNFTCYDFCRPSHSAWWCMSRFNYGSATLASLCVRLSERLQSVLNLYGDITAGLCVTQV